MIDPSRFMRRLIWLIALTTCLAVKARTCVADWPHVVRYGPFVVHADFDPAPLAPLFADIARLQSELQAKLEIGLPREHVDVYLFARESSYHDYMRRYFPDVRPRKAMFIKSNSPGNVFAHTGSDFAVDLRHECTHALLHAALPMVPLWLDEGLAEYFEVPAELRAFDNSYLPTVRRNTYWRRPPSILELESLRGLNEMGESEYRSAWAWVHFMIHGPASAQAELKTFLRQIAQHTPPSPLSVRLAAVCPDLSRSYSEHFRRWHR
jgi:hypothetical protein